MKTKVIICSVSAAATSYITAIVFQVKGGVCVKPLVLGEPRCLLDVLIKFD